MVWKINRLLYSKFNYKGKKMSLFVALIAPKLLDFVLDTVVDYIESSDSEQDDKILEITKKSAEYLSAKDNNDITVDIADSIVKSIMK